MQSYWNNYHFLYGVVTFRTLNLRNTATIGYEGLRLIGEALPINSKLTDLFLDGVVAWVDYEDNDSFKVFVHVNVGGKKACLLMPGWVC